MKTRNIITIFLLTSLFLTIGCNDSTPVEQHNPLQGTKWKLVGIVDVETGDLRVLQATYYERTFTLAFDNPRLLDAKYDFDWLEGGMSDCTEYGLGSLATIATINIYSGCYEINYERRTFRIVHLTGTRAGCAIGIVYENAFRYMHGGTQFCLQDNQLRLYYNDNRNYLLFNKVEQ